MFVGHVLNYCPNEASVERWIRGRRVPPEAEPAPALDSWDPACATCNTTRAGAGFVGRRVRVGGGLKSAGVVAGTVGRPPGGRREVGGPCAEPKDGRVVS